jgi:sugar lactone lactonase YvrE
LDGWRLTLGDGVRCYALDGDMIGRIHLPEGCANLCCGGKKRHRLFMTASTSVLFAAPQYNRCAEALTKAFGAP